MSVRVITGNCAKILPTLAAGSVDAIVTDPPAGISFMGKMWDKPGVLGVSGGRAMPSTTSSRNPSCRGCGGRRRAGPKTKACACAAPDWNDLAYRLKDRAAFIGFMSSAMAEGLRVLKPGGYAFVWALPRTAHWTATALEDAGFEIRDVIVHVFGTGFPKSQAQLKPAAEHWILCRKPGPLRPLRIDACRVGLDRPRPVMVRTATVVAARAMAGESTGATPSGELTMTGRWPANFVMSHAPGCQPAGTRQVASTGHHPARRGAAGLWSGEGGGLNGTERPERHMGTAGIEEVPAWVCAEGQEIQCYRCGAWQAWDEAEEEAKCDVCRERIEKTAEVCRTRKVPLCPVALMDEQSGERKARLKVNAADTVGPAHEGYQRPGASCYTHKKAGQIRSYEGEGGASRFFHTFPADPFVYQAKASRKDRGEGNRHPTVKSHALMRHLVGLVAGPGDLVLDPFLGSGTTAVVCAEEGIACLGIEQDAASVKIARARIRAAERACAALPAAAPAPTPPATPRRAAAPRRTRCAS